MLKRTLAALLEGAVPGAAVAFGLSKLGVDGAGAMYAAAALVGVLTGLVAGRPIWAKAAKIEGLLKAVAGAFISVVVLYALRKWLPGFRVDLAELGTGPVGTVPWVALPGIGVALATVLEVDDAFGAEPTAPVRRRVSPEGGEPESRLESSDDSEESDVAHARRKG